MKCLCCIAAVFALLSTSSKALAQQVVGRAVSEADGSPLREALLVLIDDRGQERARTATSPSGGFELRAPGAGRYRVRVQRIGQRSWETPPFDLAAQQIYRPTLRVPDRPFQLQELSASAQRPDCSVTLGDATVGADLLVSAQTALGLAEAEMSKSGRRYATETYRRLVPVVGPVEDTTVVQGKLSGWPIQSADPDSLRLRGFVQGEWPAPSPVNDRPEGGPTYFAPDARVLFTDWFLGSHCISVESSSDREGSEIVARFKPAKGTHSTKALQGSLDFDRNSLALRSLQFQFVARPRWAPKESASGEIQFMRLPDGAWLPVEWSMRAPVPRVVGGPRYRLYGVAEVGGRVTAIYDANGNPDPPAESALREWERQLSGGARY